MKQDDKDIEASYKKGFHNGSDAHKLNTAQNSISLLFEKYDGLVGKIEQLKEVIQPKPPTMLTVIGGIASIIVILATLVGTVVNITKSSIAPISAKIEQLDGINQKIEELKTSLSIQNSKSQGAVEQIKYNKATIDWILKEENFLKLVYKNTENIKHNKDQFKIVNKYFKDKIKDLTYALNELKRSKNMKGKK